MASRFKKVKDHQGHSKARGHPRGGGGGPFLDRNMQSLIHESQKETVNGEMSEKIALLLLS